MLLIAGHKILSKNDEIERVVWDALVASIPEFDTTIFDETQREDALDNYFRKWGQRQSIETLTRLWVSSGGIRCSGCDVFHYPGRFNYSRRKREYYSEKKYGWTVALASPAFQLLLNLPVNRGGRVQRTKDLYPVCAECLSQIHDVGAEAWLADKLKSRAWTMIRNKEWCFFAPAARRSRIGK